MRVALVRSGIVENVVEAPDDHYVPPPGFSVVPHEKANIGDRFVRGEHQSAVKMPSAEEQKLLLSFLVEDTVTRKLDAKASIMVRLPSRNVNVDVALGHHTFAFSRAHMMGIANGSRLFRRSFPVSGGYAPQTVTMTAADVSALNAAIDEYQEAVHKAAADIIDEINSGRVTRVDQVHAHAKWPSSDYTRLELHG